MMEENSKAQIFTAVAENSERIIAFLQNLIGFDSVTGNEGEIQAFIAATLKEQRIKVDRFEPDPDKLRDYSGYLERGRSFEGRPNVVGTWRGSGGGRSLLVNGHVDTAPIGTNGKMARASVVGLT